MLKGMQVPSIQVNSGQVVVVFLLPGGAGETVLSKHEATQMHHLAFISEFTKI